MMTKADFEVLAAALREDLDYRRSARDEDPSSYNIHGVTVARAVIGVVADALAQVNPRFNRSQFLAAAGVAGGLTHETD